MRKILKRLGIGLAVALLFFALFLAAWVLVIFPNFVDTGRQPDEDEPGMVELAEESPRIDFRESNGMLYINNEVVVFLRTSVEAEEAAAFLASYEAEVDDAMADIGIYKLIFPEALTYEELEELLREIRSHDLVENAYLNTVTQWETDTQESGEAENGGETAGEEDSGEPASGEEAGEDGFAYLDPAYPNDTWNGADWDVEVPDGENWGMEAVNAPGAWGYLDQLDTVRVGLIDSMPNTAHEDLENVFAGSTCLFIDESTGLTEVNTYTLTAEDHGSHVAGIMGADWNNSRGVSGIMGGKEELYYCSVYYDSNGNISSRYGTAYSYLLALKTLIDQDVQVINISQNTSRLIGFAASRGNANAISYLNRQAELAEKGLSRIIDAREAAGESDFVIVVAAGNSNSTYYYPDEDEPYGYREEMTWWEEIKYLFGWRGEAGDSLALYNNFLSLMDQEEVRDRVIVVGAVGVDEAGSTDTQTRYTYAYYSNVGDRVDLAAPGGLPEGQQIYSCYASGYDGMSGTSIAAPHVSGAAGLVFGANPSLTGPEVKKIVTASVTGRFYYIGGFCGLLNVRDAVVNALKTQEESVNRVLRTEASDGLDVCFLVDTTGSMGDDIENARENMENILNTLEEKAGNYRVAIIDYRDFPDRTGEGIDYAYQVQLGFSQDRAAITEAINGLTLGDGGDDQETVYSALMAAVRLNWRSDAGKVIILLGDAAPLDPEPYTGYIYEDVLLALFNADISLDYENSDQRVVSALDTSLINVYTIGTSASPDAEDFFRSISSGTGGSYVSVENASDVADAIVQSIEQIDVAVTVSAQADFGDAMAGQEIDLYREGGYLFTFETDGEGQFLLEAMEAGEYQWTSRGLAGGGTLRIEAEKEQAEVETTRSYWFAPALRVWQQHPWRMGGLLAGYLAVCLLLPLCVRQVRRSRRRTGKTRGPKPGAGAPTGPASRPPAGPAPGASGRSVGPEPGASAGPASGVWFCPYCGSRCQAGDGYCQQCGRKL